MERSYLIRLLRQMALLSAVLVLLLGAGITYSVGLSAQTGNGAVSPHDQMLDVAPGGVVTEIPAGLETHYMGARDNADLFAEIPCFCGCAEVLAHRHLLDCFVRPEGTGWEAHGAGCGVCLGEAEQVLAALKDGPPDVEAIRDAVIARWGPDAIIEF